VDYCILRQYRGTEIHTAIGLCLVFCHLMNKDTFDPVISVLEWHIHRALVVGIESEEDRISEGLDLEDAARRCLSACYELDLTVVLSNEMSMIAIRLVVAAPVAERSGTNIREDKCIVVEFSGGPFLVKVAYLITIRKHFCLDDGCCDKDCEI
jgi:hypothetical protein